MGLFLVKFFLFLMGLGVALMALFAKISVAFVLWLILPPKGLTNFPSMNKRNIILSIIFLGLCIITMTIHVRGVLNTWFYAYLVALALTIIIALVLVFSFSHDDEDDGKYLTLYILKLVLFFNAFGLLANFLPDIIEAL